MAKPTKDHDGDFVLSLDDGTIVTYSESKVDYYLLLPDAHGNIKPEFTDTLRQVENIDYSLASEERELTLEERILREKRIETDLVPRESVYDLLLYASDRMGLKEHKGLAAVVGRFRYPNQELDTWYLFVVKDGIPVISTMIYKFLGDKARLEPIDVYEEVTKGTANYFINMLSVFCRKENLYLITLLDDSDLPEPFDSALFERNGFVRGYYGNMNQLQPIPGKFNVPLYLIVDR